jgi:hypothetical protein
MMTFLDVDTPSDVVWAIVLLAIAFVLWPLVAVFVLFAMALPWGSLERRRVVEVGAKMTLVTAAWCGCVLAGVWWARG